MLGQKQPDHDYSIKEHKYNEAAELVKILLAINPQTIKKIRRIEPRIHKITARHIIGAVPKIEPTVAEALVKNSMVENPITKNQMTG